MQRGVLHAAVVPVHRQPVAQRLGRCQRAVVAGIGVSQKIPARSRPLGHRVGLPPGRSPAAGTDGVHPAVQRRQRRLAALAGFEFAYLGQLQRKLIVGQRHPAARRALHQRDGFAPIPLPGENPVPQLVVDGSLSHPPLLQPPDDGFLGPGNVHAVQNSRIDQDPLLDIGIRGLFHIAAGHHLDDGQAKDPGEFPVAHIVTGHRHEGAGAGTHEHVIGNKDGYLLTVDRIDGRESLEANACLFPAQLGPLHVRFGRRDPLVCPHLVHVPNAVGVFLEEGVFGRHHHIRRAEQRVGPGGEHPQPAVRSGDHEIHLGALAAADPVARLRLDRSMKSTPSSRPAASGRRR